MPAPQQVAFEFVVGNEPEKLKGSKIRKVKSHVSREGWKTRPRKREQYTLRRCRFTLTTTPDGGTVFQGESLERLVSREPTPKTSPLQERQLGGHRLDPFGTFPGVQKALNDTLMHHYLVHMAVDIPELDQPGNRGLLRSRWFPLVISNLATFQTILLLSAANAASVNRQLDKECRTLTLKSEAIEAINRSFDDEGQRVSDGTIGAVAKMASFEAMYGTVESYQMHMAGLERMLQIRGGLGSLGLGGLLRRIVVWIDLNSSFLLNIPRRFPKYDFVDEEDILEPNPERFVAP